MRRKAPIWELLVERGLVEDRHTAESWVMAGKVLANGLRIDKPGQLVGITDEIVIKGINQRYVGKGGLEVEGALADFGIDVTGLVAIDAGASTGGFTDCLLQHAAREGLCGRCRLRPLGGQAAGRRARCCYGEGEHRRSGAGAA